MNHQVRKSKKNFLSSLFSRTSRKVYPQKENNKIQENNNIQENNKIQENNNIQENDKQSQLIRNGINRIINLNIELKNEKIINLLNKKLDSEKNRIKENIEKGIDNIASKSLFFKYFILEKNRQVENKIVGILEELYNDYIEKYPLKNTKDDLINFILDVLNFSDKNLEETYPELKNKNTIGDIECSTAIQDLYETIIEIGNGKEFNYNITELEIGVICYNKYKDSPHFIKLIDSYEYLDDVYGKKNLLIEYFELINRYDRINDMIEEERRWQYY